MKTFLAIFTVLFSISCFSQNLLNKAIVEGNLANVKALVEEKPDIVNKEIEYLTYPVIEAAGLMRMDIVKYLVEKGAKLDVKSSAKGETVILRLANTISSPNEAYMKNCLAAINYFGEQKVSFNVTDKEGKGPLLILATKNVSTENVKNFMEVVKAFMKYGAKLTDKGNSCTLNELMNAQGSKVVDGKYTDFGSFEVAKEFVSLGANVNEANEAKNTPLHVVLLNKQPVDELKVDIVKFLLEKGANPKAKNKAKIAPEDMVDKKSPLYDVLRKTKPKK